MPVQWTLQRPSSQSPIVVMISGRGSNLQALLSAQNHCADGHCAYGHCAYQVVGVVSDKPEAQGLEHARQYGVPVVAHARADFPSLKAHKQALYAAVTSFNPRFVALAGFMQIVEPEFTELYRGRLVNIHPSLLPEFPGLHTHERAIEARDQSQQGNGSPTLGQSQVAPRYHGCTVHFVDAGVDTGPIIAQAKVEVLPEDSVDSLSSRVLAQEHKLYPWALHALASGWISLSDAGTVLWDADATRSAGECDFFRPLS